MAKIIQVCALHLALSCFFLAALASGDARAKLVSLNLCADQLALELANVGQVLGLSAMSRDPALSFHWKLATAIPTMRATAESALRLAPAVVLVGQHDARYTTAILAKAGIKIHSTGTWNTLEETRAGVLEIAASLQQFERGKELVWDIDRSLQKLTVLRAYVSSRAPSFLILQRRAYAQRESVTAEVLIHAGLRDASDEFALSAAGGFVPLEKLIRARPDYLVVSDLLLSAEDQGQALLLHPAVMQLYPAQKRLLVPDVLAVCSGPATPALIDQIRLEIEAKVIVK